MDRIVEYIVKKGNFVFQFIIYFNITIYYYDYDQDDHAAPTTLELSTESRLQKRIETLYS